MQSIYSFSNCRALALRGRVLNVLVECMEMSTQCGELRCLCPQDVHPTYSGMAPACRERVHGIRCIPRVT